MQKDRKSISLLLANLSLSICCNNKRGVTILFSSCKYFWFENYSFFNEVVFDAMVPRPLSTPVVLPPPFVVIMSE